MWFHDELLSAVLSDDEPATSNQLDPFDGRHENMPHGTRTPPTPPFQSPPPASPRLRAVAQLRPVSIPDIVRDMAENNPQQKLADFDRHYMPDGVQEPYYPTIGAILMFTGHFRTIR